jgi:hypothetical protein
VLAPLALEQPIVIEVAWHLHGALLEPVSGAAPAACTGGTGVLRVQEARILHGEEDTGVVQS